VSLRGDDVEAARLLAFGYELRVAQSLPWGHQSWAFVAPPKERAVEMANADPLTAPAVRDWRHETTELPVSLSVVRDVRLPGGSVVNCRARWAAHTPERRVYVMFDPAFAGGGLADPQMLAARWREQLAADTLAPAAIEA